ncbi:hypothetical protein [Janthinobacterium sp. DSP2-3-3]|uniref:hypothetical protein n=1 Tax=Janthinobacterium sp. DSP2-3-3 TaxID=2804596 RepID=UPI003CF5C426
MTLLRVRSLAVVLLATWGLSAVAAASVTPPATLTVGQWLDKAEAGDGHAVLILAAAGKFVFPEGSRATPVQMRPELTELMGQMSARQALHVLTIYADSGFLATDPDAWRSNIKPDPVITCKWAMRAANYPTDGSKADKDMLPILRDLADEIARRLDADERASCISQGKNWPPQKP